MTQYLFGEEVLREDRRLKRYFIRYLPLVVILAALSVSPWILPQRFDWASTIVDYIMILIPNYLATRIVICSVFGVLGILVLLAGIRNTTVPRLLLTRRRVCYAKRTNTYYEARFDKIDTVTVKGRTLSVYAAGRKVFSFGPIPDPFTTRDSLVTLIEKRSEANIDEKTKTAETSETRTTDTRSAPPKPLSYSEAEPISKNGDVFNQ